MGSSATISTLDINLKGNTTGLDGALDRAGTGLGKFRQKVQEQAGAVNVHLSSIGNGVSSAFANALTNPIGMLQGLARYLGNAFLHPIQTITNLGTGLISTFRNIGQGIRQSLMGSVVGFVGIVQRLAMMPVNLVVRLALLGYDAIKSALALLYQVPALVLRLTLAGYEAIKTIVAGLVNVPKLVLRLALSGVSAVKTGIAGLKTLLSGLMAVANPMAWIKTIGSIASACWSAIPAVLGLDAALAPIDLAIGAVVAVAVICAGAVTGLAGAFLYLGSQQAKVIGDMQKTASTLGMTTQAFSALASTSGMDTEAFGTGLEHLERTLSEAAQSGGATAQALQRVGLSARDMVNASPEEQLNRIAQAMQGMTNQADRLRLSQELFGRGAGFDMTRILQNGTQGLDALQERADRFGTSFTDSQAETVRKSNKAWGEWKLGLEGIGNSAAVALSPVYEYFGTILGNIFAKISSWVKSCLPYLKMLWEGFKEAFDGIAEAFQPVYDVVARITEWIVGKFKESIPFIRQTWNIVKAVFSVAWQGIKAIVNSAIDFVKPLIVSFVDYIKESFSALASMLSGDQIATWEQFKQKVLVALITLEFGIRNFERVASLAWNKAKLKMFQWLEALSPVVSGFQTFTNFLIDGFNALNTGLATTIGRTINSIIEGYNSIAETIGRDPIEFRMSVDAPAMEHVNFAMANMGERMRLLQAEIAQQSGALSADLAAFVQRRLAELAQVGEATQTQMRRQNQQMQAMEKKDNKALEKGSAEAFSVIVGDKGDKMFVALNDIVRELRNARELDRQQLAELRARANLAIARL